MKRWKYLLSVLVLAAIVTWLVVLTYPKKQLKLIACDVGQGDAILATYGQTQILIDGGRGDKVLSCLDNYIPFWDREIELIVLTHPQTDHYAGLIDVFNNFKVSYFLTSGLDSSSQGYGVLKNLVGGSGAKMLNATSDMVIRSGSIYLDIVWPTNDYLVSNSDITSDQILDAYTSKEDPNDFSIVANLRLGEFDALLTGDIGLEVIDEILSTGLIKDVEYIKIPHHGSKNGLTKDLLLASEPELAVISVGKNSYGHPHEEVIKLLSDQGIKILRTDMEGDVVVVSDGNKFWVE